MTDKKPSRNVMQQRLEPRDSLDDFPTPPWATRALIEHVLRPYFGATRSMDALEPACNRGYMVRPLREFFSFVQHYDIHDYGFGPVRDFLTFPHEPGSVDWVITNPPFRLAEKFIFTALDVVQPKQGMAMLVRTSFLEGQKRWEKIFSDRFMRPSLVAQFAERVPMVKGRFDPLASTATSYAWLVWRLTRIDIREPTEIVWIPPCRKELDRLSDRVESEPWQTKVPHAPMPIEKKVLENLRELMARKPEQEATTA